MTRVRYPGKTVKARFRNRPTFHSRLQRALTPGEIFELDADTARTYVKAGLLEEVEGEKRVELPPPPKETADAPTTDADEDGDDAPRRGRFSRRK